MDTALIVKKGFEIKSLIEVYRDCALSSPASDAELKGIQKEMKMAREQILSELNLMKKHVRKLESGLKP